MNIKRFLIGIIIIIIVLSIGSYFYIKSNIENNELDIMTIRKSVLTGEEADLYKLFDTGNTQLFDFNINTDEVNEAWLSVMKLENNKWKEISGMNCKVNSTGKVLLDFKMLEGGHFAISSVDENNEVIVHHASFDVNDIKKNNLSELNLSVSNSGDLSIVKGERNILQLYMNGESIDETLFNSYDNTDEFSDYNEVIAITLMFK